MMLAIRDRLLPLTLVLPVLLAGCSGPSAPAAMPIGPSTLNVADAAIAGGDPDMALSVSQSVLATDPHNADALVHEGDAYYALQRCPASEAAYQLALQADPTSSVAETGIARCLLKTDPAKAEVALLLAIQDDPGNAAALNNLGIARDLQGNFAGAVDPYRRALLANPSLTAAEVNLGLSLALSGDGPAALEYLGPLATGQQATPKIREDYAAALVASGRNADARQVLAIDLAPTQVDSAVAGFTAVIAQAQAPLPTSGEMVQPAPPTAPQVSIGPVASQPLALNMPAAPADTQASPQVNTQVSTQVSTQAYTPDNSTSAYSGPSPIAGAVSSSEGAPPELPGPAMTAARPARRPMSAPPAPAPTIADANSQAAAPETAAPAAASGSVMVQLAALDSQADAEAAWSKISSANPSLFSARQPDIENAVVKGKTYYRLRTGGFDSLADAARFCGEVSAAGTTCTVARF